MQVDEANQLSHCRLPQLSIDWVVNHATRMHMLNYTDSVQFRLQFWGFAPFVAWKGNINRRGLGIPFKGITIG